MADVPLEEIRAIIQTDSSEQVRERLIRHRERLRQRLAAQEHTLAYLETLINQRESTMQYEIEIVESNAQTIASIRLTTDLRRISDDIGTGFGTLMQSLSHAQLPPAGSPFIVYHDVIDEDTEGDIELAVPVAAATRAGAELNIRQIPGGAMATTVHRGPYHEVGPAYHALTTWITEHGHHIAGPPRETYLNDPTVVKPAELLTRVEFPIHPNND